MPKLILITGATSGFGEATARRFAAEGHRVIITGRRKERLEALRSELEGMHGKVEGPPVVHPLHFDVRDNAAVQEAITSLPPAWSAIDVLVNNAGLAAGLDPIQEGHLEDWERMLDTNVKGLLHVSKAVIPGMIARKTGHIINIGSTAGKEVYPKGNVYCASKYAVDALTKGMRIDLLPHGIKVTQIAPGMAETEFSSVRFGGDEARAAQVYQGLDPLRPEDVAELVYYVTTLPAHVCVNDLVVTPTAQANSTTVVRS
ncbi:MAG: SDR family oxidoreductase [Flavobacteriales bacterium]|nr:SDR family oxidoreductase [Flavobacteriales bacterium]MBK7270146.1 SDR family oxidoreductase [Flavobacteriales bacterium]MBK9076386.1 SDR family oxidoreductase [Flavobacteriales bacterium]MBK9539444.1 SDR family oxidoreductase [Flavobacteriales bacterium]